MQPFKYKIMCWEKEPGYYPIEIDAVRTVVPGVLLTAADGFTDPGDVGFRLTHEASGFAMTPPTHDVFGLLRLAEVLGALQDWTLDGKTVVKAKGVPEAARASGIVFLQDPRSGEARIAANAFLGISD